MIAHFSMSLSFGLAAFVRIPFQIENLQSLWVSGYNYHGSPMRFCLSAGNQVAFISGNCMSVLAPTTDASSMHRFTRSVDDQDSLETASLRNTVGIGLGSLTIREFETVAITKFNDSYGELMLGHDANEVFESLCVSESIITIPFIRLAALGDLGIAHHHAFRAQIILGEIFMSDEMPFRFGELSGGSILEIDSSFLNAYVSILTENGAIIHSADPFVFTDCSSAILPILEPIRISITGQGGIDVMPEDYLVFGSNGRCFLRLSQAQPISSSGARIIDPFSLSLINVKLTSSYAQLCDSY